jgi:hypothetical protein
VRKVVSELQWHLAASERLHTCERWYSYHQKNIKYAISYSLIQHTFHTIVCRFNKLPCSVEERFAYTCKGSGHEALVW